MELMFRDLRALLSILGEYEYIEGSLDMVCKFFQYKETCVKDTQVVWG